MPTRRIVEVVVAVDVLLQPIKGMARIWAHKTLGSKQPGSIIYGVAEIVSVMV